MLTYIITYKFHRTIIQIQFKLTTITCKRSITYIRICYIEYIFSFFNFFYSILLHFFQFSLEIFFDICNWTKWQNENRVIVYIMHHCILHIFIKSTSIVLMLVCLIFYIMIIKSNNDHVYRFSCSLALSLDCMTRESPCIYIYHIVPAVDILLVFILILINSSS